MKLPFPKQQKQVSGKIHSRQGKKMYVKVIGQSKRFFFLAVLFPRVSLACDCVDACLFTNEKSLKTSETVEK